MTALLVLVGGVVGSVLGTFVLLLLGVRQLPHWTPETIGATWLIATMIGTPLGAVGAPVLGWVFLRRVPLGRAIMVTAMGTVAGSLAGGAIWRLARIGGDVGGLFLIAGAVAGFVLTAFVLWVATSVLSQANLLPNERCTSRRIMHKVSRLIGLEPTSSAAPPVSRPPQVS